MQPYQEASKEIQRQGEFPKRGLEIAGSLTGTALGGGALLNRVLPFLSKYIPENIAIQGLNKIDPRFGKFINTALNNGKSFDEIKEFIKDKSGFGDQQESGKLPNKRNIIEQYSPELHQFLSQEIQKGRPIIEAGALAQANDKFKNIIKKMSQDHKTDFSVILQSIYGNGNQGQQNGQMQTQAQGIPNQAMQQVQNSGQGQGLDPQLAQLMQGIRSSIQNLRGGNG